MLPTCVYKNAMGAGNLLAVVILFMSIGPAELRTAADVEMASQGGRRSTQKSSFTDLNRVKHSVRATLSPSIPPFLPQCLLMSEANER